MSWLSGYTTRKKITIDPTKVDSALVSFPVFVKLRSTNFDFALTTGTGNDIRFTAANGISLLDFERDRHDKTNQLAEYQVSIPSVSNSASTEFYIYFKNDPSIIDGSNPTGVWDTSFQGRWSLDEDPVGTAPQIRDSTANANHGATHGAMTSAQSVEGKIGRALDFDGSNDYVEVPYHLSLDNPSAFTLETWANTAISPADYIDGIVFTIDMGVIAPRGYGLYLSRDIGVWSVYYNNVFVGSLTTVVKNIWYHIVGTYDGTTLRLSINGLLEAEQSAAVGTIDNFPLRIGTQSKALDRYFNGRIDEVRISNTARSTAWIKASYNSSKNTLVTISATESNLINRSVSATPQATVLATRNISIPKFLSVSATPRVLIERKPFSKQLFRSVSATPQVLIERKPSTRQMFQSVSATPQVLIDRKPRTRQMSRSVSVTPRANIMYVLDDTMASLMKLPTRKFDSKLSIWFDGPGQPAATFTDDQIESIHLLHELNDGIAVGELSISLLNQNFELTPSNPDSPFFNRFKPGLKIQAELGIHGPARIEWTQLGIYYLDSWNAPATTNTLSLVAYDQLFQLLESKVLLGKQPAKANTTAQIMLSEALNAVGITNPDLTAMQPSIPIDIGWFTKNSPVQQVSLLLASGDFIVFVDRATDKVRVIPEGFSIQKRVYRFDSSTVFEAHNPQDYVGAKSIVEYSFSRSAVKPFEEVWSGAELQGTHTGLELTTPVAMLEFSRQKGIADWTIDAGVTHCDITVLKSSIPSLKLFGCPTKDYPELVVATNPFAVQQYGKRVLRKANRFVQNRTLATQLAEKQLARVSDHTNSFKFVSSGQPALSFNHLVRLKIPEHRVDVDTLVLTKTETIYDGGLRLRAEGRRLTKVVSTIIDETIDVVMPKELIKVASTIGNPDINGAIDVDWNPTGDRLAVVGRLADSCVVFNVSKTTETLTKVASTIGNPDINTAESVKWNPAGNRLAVASVWADSCVVFSVNETTGTLTKVASTIGNPDINGAIDVDWNPTGDRLAVVGVHANSCVVFSINETAGTLIKVASTIGNLDIDMVESVKWNPTGDKLAVVGAHADSCVVFSINETTGTLIKVASTIGNPDINGTESVDWNPTGDRLAVVGAFSNSCVIFSINETAGTLIKVASTIGNLEIEGPRDVKWSPTGDRLAVAGKYVDSCVIFSIDETAGTLTKVASTIGNPDINGTESVDWNPTGDRLAVVGRLADSCVVFAVTGEVGPYLPIAADLCLNGTADKGLLHWEHCNVSVVNGVFVLPETGAMTQSRDVLHLSENARALGVRFDFKNPGTDAEICFAVEFPDHLIELFKIPLVPDIFNRHFSLDDGWTRQIIVFPEIEKGKLFSRLHVSIQGAVHIDNIVFGLVYVEGQAPPDIEPVIYVRAREHGENLWVRPTEPTAVTLKEGDLWVKT